MLTAIELECFKCFAKLVLPLRPLTLLTGRNASGKSTVLQALVLMQQTLLDSEWSRALHLNGSLMTQGTAADVVDKVSGRRGCAVALATEHGRCQWSFSGRDRRAMTLPIERIRWARDDASASADDSATAAGTVMEYAPQASQEALLRRLVPLPWWERSQPLQQMTERIVSMQYVSAERMGPRETYPMLGPKQRYVGAVGQNAPSLIYALGDERVAPELVIKGTPPTLRNQVQAWMRAFFPGCGLDVQPVANANLVTLGIRTSDETDYHRPQHVGFGLTHILPIITAALIVRAPQIILIENPEVHLHPAGQSSMGQFLARVAATGVQVLVETHSDHILNGMRRAVRNQGLAAEDVAIHFFRERGRSDDVSANQVVSPMLDAKGNVDHWPDGFFDQFDKDMDFFADWGGDADGDWGA